MESDWKFIIVLIDIVCEEVGLNYHLLAVVSITRKWVTMVRSVL
jgi:hypothetical protein